MSNAPLMPMATAVWLVENTTLTFKQIADFCKLHEVEIQGIADGEVAKGIVGYNPIMSGQLTREEINLSSEDTKRPLNLKNNDVDLLLINLKKIGYPYIDFSEKNKNNFKIIDAFHRHFLPDQLGKKPTLSSLKISKDLLKLKNT